MPVHTLLKSLINRVIRIVLKNETSISGKMIDIDIYMNIKIQVDGDNLFVRGSSIKNIWIPESNLNLERMENATRKIALYKTMIAENSNLMEMSPKEMVE
ncbi:U6 snRNA-associated Sm-like protein LSm2 [Nematocida sp. AWRm80]|nr:U6 snRNA-associated Sm-like protein LSm2 [Nematocida sp. AWRm80]